MVMQSRKRNGLTDGFFDSNATSNINISPVTTSNGNGGSARAAKLWNSTRSNGTWHKLSPRSRGDSQKTKSKSPKSNNESSHAYAIHKSAKKSVGPWSEHVSSSSKMYYFDWRTEVSQWDKPAIWLEDDKLPQDKQQQLQKTKSPSISVHRTPSSSKSTSNSSNGSMLNRRDHHTAASSDVRDNKYRRMSSSNNRTDDNNDDQSVNSRLSSTGTASTVNTHGPKEHERLQPSHHPHPQQHQQLHQQNQQQHQHQQHNQHQQQHQHHKNSTTSSLGSIEAKNSPVVEESITSNASSTTQQCQADPSISNPTPSTPLDRKEEINEKAKFDIKEDTRNMMSDQFKNFCDNTLIEHTANWLTNSFYSQTKVDRFQNMKLDYAPNFLKVKNSRARARFHSTQYNHFEQKIVFLRQRYDDIENGRNISTLSAATTPTCSSNTASSTAVGTSSNLLPAPITTQPTNDTPSTTTNPTPSSTSTTT